MPENSVVTIRGTAIGEGLPKVICPVVGKEQKAVLASAALVKAAAPDLIEWRADLMEGGGDPETACAMLRKLRDLFGEHMPILFTYRTRREGGEGSLSEAAYAELNTRTAACADLIDAELSMGDDLLAELMQAAHGSGCKVVCSSHSFTETPPQTEIVSRLLHMDRLGADICKIAVMPKAPADVLTLLSATNEAHTLIGRPLITMAMGRLGAVTRLAGETFGSAATFAAAGGTSAPGQMEIGPVRAALRLLRQSPEEPEILPAFPIFLIGFMGAGKSTIAAGLGRALHFPVLEMDEEIAARAGMSIPEIFAQKGEEAFRDMESELIAELADGRGQIISCGGGAVLRPENAARMKEGGVLILLTATPETIASRVGTGSGRPLLEGRADPVHIKALMDARADTYAAAAEYSVTTDGKSPDEICEEIMALLGLMPDEGINA